MDPFVPKRDHVITHQARFVAVIKNVGE